MIPKSEAAVQRINAAVGQCFLFASLDPEQLKDIVDAMEEKKVAPGDRVIEQGALVFASSPDAAARACGRAGATGDYFYIIDHGKFDVMKRIDGAEKKVFAYDEKGSFGELALMYNCPRAATVQARCRARTLLLRWLHGTCARTGHNGWDTVGCGPANVPQHCHSCDLQAAQALRELLAERRTVR